jgi:hypothetical protein
MRTADRPKAFPGKADPEKGMPYLTEVAAKAREEALERLRNPTDTADYVAAWSFLNHLKTEAPNDQSQSN